MLMSETRFDEAIDEAARILAAAELPVVGGLGTDVTGAVAAFRLAEQLRGILDHMSAEAGLREQAVLQSSGLMLIRPEEARQRADVFLIVGDGATKAWPELPGFLQMDRPVQVDAGPRQRRILTLSETGLRKRVGRTRVAWIKADEDEVPGMLAALRARINGRPVASDFATTEIERCAETLREAAFGVAIWSPDELDSLTIEMLVGLIKDLNGERRWSGMSVVRDASMSATAMASGWMSGLPLRVSFAGARAEHDPLRFDSRRLVESGEADVVLWISALGVRPPRWLKGVPIVLLAGPDYSPPDGLADVVLPVGRPGKDHDAIVYDRRTGTVVAMSATAPTNLPTVADTLKRIAERLAEP
jgi:formylmethanofuran dehydrogenase subunit B